MSQCCCDCNCTPCCCNQPSAAHTYENGAVNDINAGNALRVSDRNGNPKDLVGDDYTVPNTYNGKVANRSGAEGDEVKLKLKELSGNAVAVVHVDGDSVTILGIVKPEDGDDSFLMQLNGEMKFKKHPTFTALFEENQIDESKTGKIALITCGPNGTLQLSKFSGCGEVKPLIVDAEGNVLCESICEYINDVEEGLDSIWGCEDGNWRKLTAENGKKLIVEDGKFKLGEDAGSWHFLDDPYEIFSQSGLLPVNEVGSKDISTVPDWDDSYTVAIMHIEMYGIVPGSGPADYHARLKVSGINRGHILIVPAFGSQASSTQFFVPIPESKTISYELEVQTGTAGDGAGFSAKLFVDGFTS